MATYGREERLAAIQKAGFANPLTALAVSLAEFGENRDINTQAKSDVPNEESYGPWQIHLPSHPDVTRACAMDLNCSTAKAYAISKGGTDFGPWAAFNNGGYRRFLEELTGPLKELASPSPVRSGGDTKADQPSAAPTAEGCGLDALSMFTVGERLKRGESAAAIADDMTSRLGRPITVSCLQADAYKVAHEVGTGRVPGEDAIRGLGGGLASFTDLLKTENLWRTGFIALGAALIFIGGRMYFHESPEPMRERIA